MKEDKRIYILKEEKPAVAVLKLGLPLVAGMFIMVLYNLVDTFFIGLLRDDYQLAAVNLAYPIMMISIAISNMIATGAGSLIARSLGKGDTEKAEHTVTVGVLFTLIGSLIVTVLGLLLLDPIVIGLGAQDNTFLYTKQYAFWLFLGTIFTMGNYTLGQLLRSEGSVRYSLIGMVVGTLANIALDPLFIFGFHLEIRGAAIATILGNAIGMTASILVYLRKKSLLHPSPKYIRPTKEIVREIFWVGVPATMETLLISVAYIINNNLAVAYGELTVAAMGVAQKIMSVGTYIYQGMAAGVQPIMGYNYGAKNYKRMLAVLRSGILVLSGIELGVMAVFGIFAPQLIALFTDSGEVIEIGSRVLRTIMLILPFVGAVSMSRISFQAIGKAQYSFIITVIRQLALYVPLLLILNNIFGFGGMLFAQPITEAIMMIVSVWMLVSVIRSVKVDPRDGVEGPSLSSNDVESV